jgi:hypothetical protein
MNSVVRSFLDIFAVGPEAPSPGSEAESPTRHFVTACISWDNENIHHLRFFLKSPNKTNEPVDRLTGSFARSKRITR